MPFININSLGQPLPDHEIQRNHILHRVNMVFESTTSLERQVVTLQEKNENLDRELIRSNLRYTNTTINLKKLDDELKLLKSANAHLEVRIGAFVKVVAQAEGQIGYLEEANSQLQGQLDSLHQLNRQLTQEYGQVIGLLNASKTQHQEVVDQVKVLNTQNQLSKDVVDSNSTGE
jgi:chromosome segregation ATPase